MTVAERIEELSRVVNDIEQRGHEVRVDSAEMEYEDALVASVDIGIEDVPEAEIEEEISQIVESSQAQAGEDDDERVDSNDETSDKGSSADTSVGDDAGDADDDVEKWCGICGAGPFEMLSVHHGRLHEGEPIALDHEPSEEELIEDGERDHTDHDDLEWAAEYCDSLEEAATHFGVTKSTLREHLFDANIYEFASPAKRIEATTVGWVDGDPRQHLDESGVDSGYEEFLDAVEDAESISDLAEHLGVHQSDLDSLLWELGLRKRDTPQFIGGSKLHDRLEGLRSVVA